jgi:hypothetical protein
MKKEERRKKKEERGKKKEERRKRKEERRKRKEERRKRKEERRKRKDNLRTTTSASQHTHQKTTKELVATTHIAEEARRATRVAEQIPR